MDKSPMLRDVDILKSAEEITARDHGSKGVLKHAVTDMPGLRSFLLLCVRMSRCPSTQFILPSRFNCSSEKLP
jgi:hypothetical protein